MNFRNKKLVTAIRIILGLFILMSGVTGWMSIFNNMEGIPAPMLPYMQSLTSVGIVQMIKTTEVIVGLMLIFNFLPALAAIFLAPICIGVIIFNAMVSPEYVVTGVIISILNGFLGYAYWDKYKALFQR